MSAIVLKIFSGAHFGAEIELAAGTWTIGQNDSCDIILSDKGIVARHIALSISGRDEVKFRTLDGEVFTKFGETVSDGELQERTLYKLGGVFFAWLSKKDAFPEVWEAIAKDLMAAKPAPAPAPEATTPQQEEATTAEEQASEEEKPAEAVMPELPKADPESDPVKTFAGCMLTLMVFGVAVSVGYYFLSHHAKETETTELMLPLKEVVVADAELEGIKESLKQMGFADLSVEQAKSGAYSISGFVKDDDQRGQLLSFTKTWKHPAFVDVVVSDDYTKPLKEAFNRLDFWPEVSLRKTGNEYELLVSSYMLSKEVEEKGFTEAKKSLPAIDFKDTGKPLNVRGRIYHRDAVQGLVTNAFKKQGLAIKAEYLSGRIKLTAQKSDKVEEKLKAAMTDLQATCEVPLKIDLVRQSNKPTEVEKRPAPVIRSSDPMKPTFVVDSVSGGVLKFVTLSNGDKCFIGGVLPGGFVLESITLDRLTLVKNNQKIIYPLKAGRK